MNRTAVLAVAAGAIVVLLAASIVAPRFFRSSPETTISASGTIEATQSDVSPKVQGRLIFLPVQDGDAVKKGSTVAVLEQTNPALGFDQAQANVTAASAQVVAAQAAYELQQNAYQAQLTQASEGVSIAGAGLGQARENLNIESRSALLRVDQAQSQLVVAASVYNRAKIELVRARSLVSTGDQPQRSLDDAIEQNAAAEAQLQAARDALALAEADQRNVQIRELGVHASRSQHGQSLAALDNARAERALVNQRHAQLLAAQAQLAQARAAAGLAGEQLRETKLVAPFNGFVVSHNFEVGDLISPGAAVMTIADLTHPYLNVYVQESDLPRIKTGMRADVTIDGIPGRTFTGRVTEIAGAAEFTPENVQTKEARIEYLVFRVKIQFTDTSGMLKPGLPADAVIHV